MKSTPIFSYPTQILTVYIDVDKNLCDFEEKIIISESQTQIIRKDTDHVVRIEYGDDVEFVSLDKVLQEWLKSR